MEEPGGELMATAREIAVQLGLRRIPRLRMSRDDVIPFSTGVLRPVVVLPARITEQSSPVEVRAILFHELAHHRRGDLWVNLVQLAIGAAWWFHPVVWLLNRAIRSVREECCDDLLLSRKFVSDIDYCTTLVHVADTCARRRPSSLVVAVSMVDGSHPLTSRIRRIMDESLPRYERLGAWTLLALLALAVVVLPGVRAVSTPRSDAAGAGIESQADWSPEIVPISPKVGKLVSSTVSNVNTEPIAEKDDRTLQGGAAVFGRVTDRDGQPIAAATVALGQYVNNFDSPSIATTGDDGSFRLEHCPEGNSLLTVFKIGLAPHMRTVAVSETGGEFNLVLVPGHLLRVRVTDKAGQPVENADVSPFKWADTVTLTRLHNFGKTDADGIWTWDWAPDEELTYMIFKDGYVRIKNLPLRPRAALHDVQLQPELRVGVKVIDDATGRPIPEFRATLGLVHELTTPGGTDKNRPSPEEQWLQSHTVASPDGAFTIRHGEFPWGKYVARIDAHGYDSAKSRIYLADERDATIEFRLQRAKRREAIAHNADGTPAASASLLIGTSANPASIRDDQPDPSGRATVVAADADGRFRFDVPTGDFTLFVVHRSGFARVPRALFEGAVEEPIKIVLQPWARIEGTVRKRQTPLPEAMVQLDFAQERRDSPGSGGHGSFNVQTKSDANGRFVFARVPPEVAVVVTHYGPVRTPRGPFLGSHNSLQFQLAAGQVRTISVGGTGRTVVGRFRLKDDAWAADWQTSIGTLHRTVEPANPDAGGITYRPAPLFDIEPDGSFRIDDVPPGTYRIAFSLLALKPESILRQGPRAIPQNQKGMGGLVAGEVTVADADERAADQSVDIGILHVGYANAPAK